MYVIVVICINRLTLQGCYQGFIREEGECPTSVYPVQTRIAQSYDAIPIVTL